jgi:hypothetical protein
MLRSDGQRRLIASDREGNIQNSGLGERKYIARLEFERRLQSAHKHGEGCHCTDDGLLALYQSGIRRSLL